MLSSMWRPAITKGLPFLVRVSFARSAWHETVQAGLLDRNLPKVKSPPGQKSSGPVMHVLWGLAHAGGIFLGCVCECVSAWNASKFWELASGEELSQCMCDVWMGMQVMSYRAKTAWSTGESGLGSAKGAQAAKQGSANSSKAVL